MILRVCGIGILLAALAQAQATLEWNKRIESSLEEGQTEVYSVNLVAGQYIEILAEQPETSVKLALSDPGGKPLQSVLLTGVGTKQLLIHLAEAAGAYRLEVSSGRKGAGGKYAINWVVSRTADDRDRQASAADGRLRALIDSNKPDADGAEKLAAEFERLGMPRRQALALMTAGRMHGIEDRYDKALVDLGAALPLWRATGDRGAEGRTLLMHGECQKDSGKKQEAFDDYQHALEIYREINDRAYQANALVQMAGVCVIGLGRFTDAIRYSKEALEIERDLKDRAMEAAALGELANAYTAMGRYDDTLEMYRQALAVFREVKSRDQEAEILINIGGVLIYQHRIKEAIPNYEQAASVAHEIEAVNIEATALSNLGQCYSRLGNPAKANSYHERALGMFRKSKDRGQEATELVNLADDYEAIHQPRKAIPYYEQSLDIEREEGTRSPEMLAALADAYRALNEPRLAIFYGKQAVSVFETIRGQNSDASSELRESYMSEYGTPYRSLADALVSQGRLIEAQQVLTLLKRQEYFDLAGVPDAKQAVNLGLTPEEQEWASKYWESKDSASFQQAQAAIKQHFAGKGAVAAAAIDLKDVEAMRTTLSDLGHGAVAIQTLVTPERYVALLVTPQGRKSFDTKIKAADLNRKILAFRQALEDPQSDVRTPARELYRILIPPGLEASLQKAHAETLMWSLDGSLSYVPVAALYDGSHYLVEKYRTPVFTAAVSDAWAKSAQTNRSSWRAVAFGVSLPHEDFAPLPAVPEELRGVVKQDAGETGVLEGSRFLDEQFTRETFMKEVKAGYQVVHIASHFQFKPGDSKGSFLLLGDGGKLTLEDLKAAGPLFQGVDLLTLSACSTGVGDVKSGLTGEVEAFGMLAQRSGAKAVVASLWNVADVSTALLMRELYRVRRAQAAATEIDALRQAQLALLHGEISRSASPEARGVKVLTATKPGTSDFRHPYYWAPFFLMGDWR